MCTFCPDATGHSAQEGGITGYSPGKWELTAGSRSDCEQSRRHILKEIEMAKSNPRRAIIREWTSLTREKRRSVEQANAFADAALQRHRLPRSRRPPHDVIMAWLRPRIGRI